MSGKWALEQPHVQPPTPRSSIPHLHAGARVCLTRLPVAHAVPSQPWHRHDSNRGG